MALKIKTDKWKHLLIHIFLMLLIIIITILLSFFWFIPYYTYHGTSLTVPNLKGMSLNEAQKYMEERGLKVVVKDSIFRADTKPHTILGQSPSHGIQVKGGRRIHLTITPLQAPKKAIPNLKGMGFETAKRKLLQAGFVFGDLTYIPHPQKGNVIKMLYNGKEIKANTPLRQGAQIDFVVGGKMSETFEVPILVGLTQEEAEVVINASDLVLGRIKYVTDSKKDLGTVLRQYPKAMTKNEDGVEVSTKIKSGEPIDIWVVGTPDAAPKPIDKPEKNPNDTI